MEEQLSNFQQTVMFIVTVLVAGWYVFTNDDDHDEWRRRK